MTEETYFQQIKFVSLARTKEDVIISVSKSIERPVVQYFAHLKIANITVFVSRGNVYMFPERCRT